MSSGSPQPPSDEIADLRLRLDLMEEQNQRLRDKLEPLVGPDNPVFDARKFQRAMQRLMLIFVLPLYLGAAMLAPLSVLMRKNLPPMYVGNVPLLDCAGVGTKHPGVGVGIIAFGGVGFGVVAVGGLSIGVIAIGGGALGVVAVGGGAVGLIAAGGGAVGLIAIGGAGAGRLVLAQRGYGKYVLAINRQDDEAIAFFSRWVPGIRNAVTRLMPVIPLQNQPAAAKQG